MTSIADQKRIKDLEEQVEALQAAYAKANAAVTALAGRIDALESRKDRKGA